MPATHFNEVIATRERLRELYKAPSHRVTSKVIDRIDDLCRRFIAACPFVVVASRGADGRLDLSPKGDPAGFVAVLDEKTLAIPDRLGNNRLDTFENLLAHPEIGLLFIIPGNGDTLRLSGTGRLVRDQALRERFNVNGNLPDLVLAVKVDEVFMHCPKCIVRARLWDHDHWPDRSDVPTLAVGMVRHGALSDTVPEMQALIDKDGATRLY